MNILNLPLLDTAFSILISWALFSLLCSYIHEAMVQIKAERGRFMKACLLKQFQDLPNGVNWAALLYLNGAVDMLSRTFNKPTNEISPSVFAKTLIDVVGKAHLVQMLPDQENAKWMVYQNDTLRDFKKATECLSPSNIVNLFEQCLRDAEIKHGLQIIEEGSNVYQVSIYEANVYKELTDNLETWYSDFVERVILWYKKKTRFRLFLLGILLAMILNVDSIALFRHFNQNAASRNMMISFYAKHKVDLEAQALTLESTDRGSPEQTEVSAQLKVTTAQLDSLSKAAELPIGFNRNFVSFLRERSSDENVPMKLLGFLLTGFAACFGASFWFDVLKRLSTPKK